jgi:DNA-binding NarL/FixJ family response regulator
VLVGRDKEVGAVLDLVARRASCVLAGEAGIGKTAVLHAVRAELGDHAALGGAVQPLRWMPYLALQRACGFALGGSRAGVVEAAVQSLDGRVLLLDDLHWADPDTLEVLPELAHEVPIVGAVRTDDPDGTRALAVVRAIGSCIDLAPLADDAAHELARQIAPTASAAQLDDLVEHSGGNPLLLTCAPAATRADDRLVALVARASPPARYALARMSLAGRPSWDEECEVIRELDALGLVVRAADRGWTVRHDSFGQAAVSLLTRDERFTIHRALAETSETDGERARHHMHAGQPDCAREFALRAAEASTSRNERADHLAIAASSADPVTEAALFLDAAEALALAGRVDDGLAFAQHAAPETREDLLRREKTVAWCAWWAAQHELVWPALERATDLLTPEDTEIEVAIHMLRARYLARVKWDAPAALVEARAAVALAEREGLPVAEAYGALGSATLVNRGDDWEQWLVKSIAAARSEGLESVEITSADSLFIAQMMAGETAECTPLAREMIQRARALGTRTGEAQFRKNLLVARFHVEDALEETVEVGRALLRSAVNPRQRDHIESHFVLACADLGLDEEIECVLATAYGFTAADLTARATILWAKAESDWLAGRAAEALKTAEECRALPVSGFPTHVMVEPLRQWAALDLDLDPGEPLTDILFPNLVAANKESRAIVAMYRDPGNSGNAGQFLAAGRSWERISRRNSARCALGAAEAARRSNDVDRAINILRILERELLASGRRPLLRRVHAMLRQLGEPVRAHTGTAFPPLTAAQVEVLELVGRGLDTHAIARRLVVGETTIETHIRQAMQRLGMSTRLAAAVELLRRRGDLTPPPRDDQRLALCAEEPYDFPRTALDIESLPVAPWTLDRSITAKALVRDVDDAARVVIAASRGASIVFAIAPSVSQTERAELLDALGRIAPIERLEPVEAAPVSDTDDELRTALQVLADGGTVGDAANVVHMSERTLHRRLATLRKELGLRSNVAVARAVLGAPTDA